MGITAVNDTIFNDEEEVTTAAATEPLQTNTEDYEIEEESLYARDLPTPNMTSWIIPDVRTDTTFTEMWETYQLHMEDNRATITVQLIERRSLLGRTSHEGLLEQLSRYQQLYGDINPRFTLTAYGRAYRLVEGARALMDRTDWYSFQDLQRHMCRVSLAD